MINVSDKRLVCWELACRAAGLKGSDIIQHIAKFVSVEDPDFDQFERWDLVELAYKLGTLSGEVLEMRNMVMSGDVEGIKKWFRE